jgi:electron transfer flavoprotein alpha/beta subunit
VNEPRIPTLKTILKSKKMEIKRLKIENLKVKLEKINILDIKRYVIQRKNIIWDASEDLEKAIDNLFKLLVSGV